MGPRLQVGLHCSEVEQELLAGLETLVVLVVKRGLQRGKRVHSGWNTPHFTLWVAAPRARGPLSAG